MFIIYNAQNFDADKNHYWMNWTLSPKKKTGCEKVMFKCDPLLSSRAKDHMLISYKGKGHKDVEKFWETSCGGPIIQPRKDESSAHYHGRYEVYATILAEKAIDRGEDVLVVADLPIARIVAQLIESKADSLCKVRYLDYWMPTRGLGPCPQKIENIPFMNLEDILPQDFAYLRQEAARPASVSALSCLP